MIARRSRRRRRRRAHATRSGSAASSGSMWIGSPITPVEHARTSAASTPSAAAAAETTDRASASPRSPVAAFAWPLLTSTARPSTARRCARGSGATGAAATRFVVNRPATVVPGSPTSSAEVGGRPGFRPARDAGRPEPLRVRDARAHGYTAVVGSAGRSSMPVDEVGVLDRLPGGALHQVVERTDHDRSARACVRHGLQLDHVRTARSLGSRPSRRAPARGRTPVPRTPSLRQAVRPRSSLRRERCVRASSPRRGPPAPGAARTRTPGVNPVASSSPRSISGVC